MRWTDRRTASFAAAATPPDTNPERRRGKHFETAPDVPPRSRFSPAGERARERQRNPGDCQNGDERQKIQEIGMMDDSRRSGIERP
ncbi:hypothetical protein [Frankia sp. AgKG'84/4]|uniref:hypothetical protein n=1 Tax=Frankia sp. AgKG'84/4 TaxID=573490 RepID=UPI00200C3739|nr:hypothetical protein [Frankia sp. AgKG'84/4]MCL9795613.1 hypothetical protein [Frankia sp. AgKG'84/4]